MKAALAVEEEMEKIKAEQILPQDSTPTTMTKTKRWNVTEGPYGEWKGTWIIDPNHPDFNIVLKSQYGTIRSSGRYTKNGDSVSIERTGSSDGNDCNYTGNISGKKVSGTYFCKNGGPFQWNATISD